MAASTPRHAQVRIIAPVFWAISGSNNASRSGAGGSAITRRHYSHEAKNESMASGRKMSPSRVEPASAGALPPMDIQFDQCEKPRRTLTCAEAQRSMRAPETCGLHCGDRCGIDIPKSRDARARRAGRRLRVDLTERCVHRWRNLRGVLCSLYRPVTVGAILGAQTVVAGRPIGPAVIRDRGASRSPASSSPTLIRDP
jgi:hypothetical protein